MPSEEELLTRQMPHSTEAEQSVLGSMLIDARCVPEVIEALRPEDFYLRTNREIYETIYSMFNFSLTIDPVTVLEHMKQNGVYDENTSRNYILQLMEITPTAANVKEYVAIVKDKALLRRIAETAGELTAMVQEGTGTAQEVLEAAEFCANLLEACELVPMYDPPTARIARIRKAGDEREARKLAYELAVLLQEKCLLL